MAKRSKSLRRSIMLLLAVGLVEFVHKGFLLTLCFPLFSSRLFSTVVGVVFPFTIILFAGFFLLSEWAVKYVIFYSVISILSYPLLCYWQGISFGISFFIIFLAIYAFAIRLFSSPLVTVLFFSKFHEGEIRSEEKRFKLLLVKPKVTLDLYHKSGLVFPIIPSLSLAHLAGLTPNEFEVEIVDEETPDKVTSCEKYDLVALSVLEKAESRAQEIYKMAKSHGKTVVCGGFLPTMYPDRGKAFSDTVVAGDAEDVWSTVLNDFSSGSLKGFYEGGRPANLENLPRPRMELLNPDYYLGLTPVQTSRGCTAKCDFCSIKNFYHGIAHRPLEEIFSEIKLSHPKVIHFVDNNIFMDRDRFKKLCEGLIPLNIQWIAQCPIGIADDKETLEMARRSGCLLLYIGIETLENLNAGLLAKKCQKEEEILECLARISDVGILTLGSFMIGLDHDSPESLKRLRQFCNQSRLQFLALNIYRPVKGTKFHKQLQDEGRLLTPEKILRRAYGIVEFIPRLFSPETLYAEYIDIYKDFYSPTNICRKLWYSRNKLDPRFIFELGFYIYNYFVFKRMKNE